MDVFVEQLITEKGGARRVLYLSGLTLAGVLIVLAVAYFVTALAPLALLGVGFGWWQIMKMLLVEYEYSVTNGDIDIDRIRGRSRRTRLVSVRGEKIESLSPSKAGENFDRFDRVVRCVSGQPDKTLWRFTYHSKKNGHTVVLFEPDDRVLRALVEGLPSLLQREVKKADAYPAPPEMDVAE